MGGGVGIPVAFSSHSQILIGAQTVTECGPVAAWLSLRDLVQHEILAGLPRRPIAHIRRLFSNCSPKFFSFCISAEEEGAGHQVSKCAQGPRAGTRGHASHLLHAVGVLALSCPALTLPVGSEHREGAQV